MDPSDDQLKAIADMLPKKMEPAGAIALLLEIHEKMPWVANTDITQDTEKLRAIALAYGDWWNNRALPYLREWGYFKGK